MHEHHAVRASPVLRLQSRRLVISGSCVNLLVLLVRTIRKRSFILVKMQKLLPRLAFNGDTQLTIAKKKNSGK